MGIGVDAVSKQCPADKPTKMCCADQSLAVNSSTQRNINANTTQPTPSTSNKETGSAAMTGVPVLVVAGAAAGTLLVLQKLWTG